MTPPALILIPRHPTTISQTKYQSVGPTYTQIDPGTYSSKNSDFDPDDVLSEYRLLGPFRYLMKITGLDCSSSVAPKSCFSRILAILIITILFIRCILLFNVTSRTMSVQWAESNMFAFMSIHSIICAFCLFTWTKNGFVSKHLERLEVVRKLRISQNYSLDDYSLLHKKSFIWAGLWFLCIMTHSITSTLFQRFLLTTEPQPNKIINIFLPVATFISCLAVTLCLITYVLVNCSLTRELEQFNRELEEVVVNGRGFEDAYEIFSNRQAELIKVVRKANESLGSYAAPGPIFCFFGMINGVYIVSFLPQLPTSIFIVLLLNLIAIITITIFTLRPPSNVQHQITDTSRILLESGELQKIKSFKVMIDRSLKTDTRIRAAGGIPISHNSMMVSLLVLPNLGNVLGVIKNVLVANGVQI